jgi:hypothetical protein
MATIELRLKKTEDATSGLALFFNLHSTRIAKKYFRVLRLWKPEGRIRIKEADSYNFPGDTRDDAWIANEINKCIAIINAQTPVIHHQATTGMVQEQLNRLHKYYEVLRGPLDQCAEFYQQASPEVQLALEDYNVLIHRYEDYKWAQVLREGGKVPLAKFILNLDEERFPLADEDYEHFTTEKVFGRYYLNYCEVGKPLLDFYADRDEIVGENNIVPLRYFSSNALIEFFHPSAVEDYKVFINEFHEWWLNNEERLEKLGFKRNDPKNSIGLIPLADLDRDRGMIKGLSEMEILELIGQYPIVSGLVAHRD